MSHLVREELLKPELLAYICNEFLLFLLLLLFLLFLMLQGLKGF